MTESHENYPDPFTVEAFRGHVVDIVHRQSVCRIAEGEKPADFSDRKQAIIVQKRIDELKNAGITVREIDDVTSFNRPDGFGENDSLILGGAFFGQCLAAYQETLDKQHVQYTASPLLTVRA